MKFRYLKNVVTLQLDQSKCNGCGVCIDVCPQQVFTLAEKVSSITDRDACMECGACARNCAFSALSVRAGVGCAAAIINVILGRTDQPCCGPSDCGGGDTTRKGAACC